MSNFFCSSSKAEQFISVMGLGTPLTSTEGKNINFVCCKLASPGVQALRRGTSGREVSLSPLSSSPELACSAGEGRKEGLLFPLAMCPVFPLGGRKACLKIGSSPAWCSVGFVSGLFCCASWPRPPSHPPPLCRTGFVLSPLRAFDVRLSSRGAEGTSPTCQTRGSGVLGVGWVGRVNKGMWGEGCREGTGAAAPCLPVLGWGTRQG